VEFVPEQAPVPVRVSIAAKLPTFTDGVNVARAGLTFCVQVPRPAPPDQVAPEYVPEAEAFVIVIGANGEIVQLLRSGPASAKGVCPQVIVRVSIGFVPRHLSEPITVSVAVKEPDGTEGVKVASAGFAFWVQVPWPVPPDHARELYVPLADAPAIMIGARGVASQRVIFGPASTAGVWLHAISLVRVITMPPHEVVAVTVNVAVNEALGTEGVKYARAGLLFCVHVPRPAPPVQIAEA